MAAPGVPADIEANCDIKPRGRTSGKSSAEGGALFGDKVIVALIHKQRGSGSKRHTHPNEQFNYVLSGTLLCNIDDQTLLCPAGHCIHIPAGIEHGCVATEDEDAVYFVAKDTRHGIAGPPVDGVEDGPRYLPGGEPLGDRSNRRDRFAGTGSSECPTRRFAGGSEQMRSKA